jgi:hypothetical protein
VKKLATKEEPKAVAVTTTGEGKKGVKRARPGSEEAEAPKKSKVRGSLRACMLSGTLPHHWKEGGAHPCSTSIGQKLHTRANILWRCLTVL